MSARKKVEAKEARRAIADVAGQLAELRTMDTAALRVKYEEVFGTPARSKHKECLRKKIAFRLQELAEGGLSERARARIAELAAEAPVRWRGSHGNQKPVAAPALDTARERDPRLPVPGAVLMRMHDGVEHKVTVLAEGFEYAGERYRSLSKIARLVTGTPWNGYLFFGLERRTRKHDGEAAA